MEELALEAERTNYMNDDGGVRPPARLCECAIKGAEGVWQQIRTEPTLVNRTIGAKRCFDMPIAAPRARGGCQTWTSARLL
jgi:hypothetical protein